jgi:hypothetical protein
MSAMRRASMSEDSVRVLVGEAAWVMPWLRREERMVSWRMKTEIVDS